MTQSGRLRDGQCLGLTSKGNLSGNSDKVIHLRGPSHNVTDVTQDVTFSSFQNFHKNTCHSSPGLVLSARCGRAGDSIVFALFGIPECHFTASSITLHFPLEGSA